MQKKEWIFNLFEAIDAKSIDVFMAALDADCRFRFGNLPAVTGTRDIQSFVTHFFNSIASLKHDIHEIWLIPDGAVCHGMVTYIRHDGTDLRVPFSNIFKTRHRRISDYLIFADTSELYRE